MRVKDVARVELGGKDYTFDSRFNGQPSASIAIYQLARCQRDDNCGIGPRKDEGAELRQQLARGTAVHRSRSTRLCLWRRRSRRSTARLLIAVLLVVLVIYVFLQDWRATIIPVVAIPVSLIGTFAIMSMIGFSINMLSLFGIVLAIGIVVDDAIVVVENTTRHLADGLQPKEAAVKAMSEITGPVIATTLVLLAVFVPSAFMGGITGQLFRQFALTISGAVLISTLNALTLSPALCGLILRAPKESSFVGLSLVQQRIRRSHLGLRVCDPLVCTLGAGRAGRLRRVGRNDRHYALARCRRDSCRIEDQGYLFVNVQLPDSASSERTRAVMRQVEEIYDDIPGVSDNVSIAGYSLLGGYAGSNLGFSIIILDPWDERTDPEKSLPAILENLQQRFSQIQSGVVFAFAPPPIDGLGAAGGFQMEVLDQGGAGYASLQATAEDLVDAGNGQSGLTGLNSSFRANAPQLFADVDRVKAKNMNVPLENVFGTLQAYLGSAYVNDFTYNNRSYQVRVQSEAEFRASADDIARLDVRDSTGQMVPLGSIVDVQTMISVRRWCVGTTCIPAPRSTVRLRRARVPEKH